jgi:hypothetical protein
MEDRIRAEPMGRDLSWKTWYGFGVLSGLTGRCLQTLKTNDNYKSLVQDCFTRRLFIRDTLHGDMVQYFPDLDAEMFRSDRLR